MLQWIKKHWTLLITILITASILIFIFSCESKVRSIADRTRMVNRQELQLELDQLIGMAQLRMVDLDKQDKLRAVVLENALILVQGQPINPLGIITGVAAIYGLTQGSCNITKVIKTKTKKRKVNNG